MIKKIYNFLKTGEDKPVIQDEAKVRSMYEKGRWSVLISITLGYGLFYVCRAGLNVIKPILVDTAHIFTADQMGIIGSVFFYVYAFGRFTNGFLSDRMNIKRFMFMGLFISSIINIMLGFNTIFIVFVILWGINGWFQSMGSAPSVVVLANWFSNKERGTRYGIWSTSHNIGGAITYVFTAFIVSIWGWRFGFIMPGLMCLVGAILFYIFMYDRPRVYGLPLVSEYKNDHGLTVPKKAPTWELQKTVMKYPAVWLLGLASACMYIVRYAVDSWGIFYLVNEIGYSNIEAASVIATSPILGIIGTISGGYLSDKLFAGRRNFLALVLGILYAASLICFAMTPKGYMWMHVASLSVFGFCLGALLTFLGGLMAVDICPKGAAGAAMGMIGIFSYIAAGVQDNVSGYLIESTKTIVDGKNVYDFGPVLTFWVAASILSFIFAACVWKAKHTD